MSPNTNPVPTQAVKDFIKAMGEDIATTRHRVWWNVGEILDVPAMAIVHELESTLKGRHQLVRLNDQTVVLVVTEEDMILSGRNHQLIDRFFDRLSMICKKSTRH